MTAETRCGDRAAWCVGAMTGLDANVIVRYIMQDDPKQSRLATRLAETMAKALRVCQDGRADLADCLINRLAAAAGADRTVTFDRAAARDAG